LQLGVLFNSKKV